MKAFDYVRAGSVAEALELAGQPLADGPESGRSPWACNALFSCRTGWKDTLDREVKALPIWFPIELAEL